MSFFLLIVFGAVFARGQNLDPDDLAAAESARRQALHLAEQKYGSQDKNLAPPLTNLALALHAEGRDAEADPLARRAVAIAQQSGDLRLIGATLNALGIVLAGEGDPARAEPVLRRSVALLEQAEGTGTLHVAQAANNLAALYADTGRYALAEKELARVLSAYEKYLGANSPLYAMAMNNMFTILYQQRRVAEGEPYLRRALAIGEQTFPGTLNMARLRERQAALEASRRNFPEAARLLKDVVATEERLLGPHHPELARALENYATVLRPLHQKTEARIAHNRALSIRKSLLSDVK